MIIDIIQTIINYCRLSNQIKCTKIDRYVYDNIYIYSLRGNNSRSTKINHSNSHYIYKMTQEIIEQKRYSRLIYLCFDNVLCLGRCNEKIVNLNHLADTLEYLSCPWNCGVNQVGISELKKIKVLLCGSNEKINNIGHFADTLEILCCAGMCGIGQNSIYELKKLKVLKFHCNNKIYDVNHLSDTLVELECGGAKNLQKGILELKKLKILNFHGNSYINNVNRLKDTIEELYCGSGIDDYGISELKNVKILCLAINRKISHINHLSGTLEKLICRRNHIINNSDMKHTRVDICSMKGYVIYSYSDNYNCDRLYSYHNIRLE